ncbi:MAG: hypothetical protein HN742_32310 [Lentisphaerae bacterium]|mgnify:CR=1 FL=1|jgi:hypothetical protein|nr:hypothetical protein [Lentisphaerota bacterium]MBT4818112.1 hypothetical protein [Lentisphaerota bacterium]MBT5611109.1 hypothetical protein [Lentisphaerota bacterium]MBT7061275.1 hypothetical protein [Lentisphaerota bacterium]MBT7846598.1 hypothetical protein [Lentisphaerota bacterium]
MTGAEIAWRTLLLEKVSEPCIACAWVMKREFFQHYAGVGDIYADPVQTTVDAFANAGCNLNAQFIMPSPLQEHRACNPFSLPKPDAGKSWATSHRENVSAESVRDEMEQLPDPADAERTCDIDGQARSYAERLLDLRQRSENRTLYISSFGMPSFMGGYSKWTYESYLEALVLYPAHMKRYFDYLGEHARLRNVAIVQAIRDHDLCPVVYGGDDICFNDGPICSLDTLDDLYFPALGRALQPLVDAGIRIVWHCDGNVLPIMDRLIAMGIRGFQGFQEREANIPLTEVVRRRTRDGEKLIVFGSVSVVHTLPYGSVTDVEAEVERCFHEAAPGGGFCLAPTSSILPETPLANIQALFEHGRTFGRKFLAQDTSA